MMESKTGNLAPILTSPLKTIFALLAILFSAETLIMFIFLPLLHLHDVEVVENFADAFMLTILCAPFVWALISGRKRAEEKLNNIYLQMEVKNRDLETAYAELKSTQAQMLQNDKMASIGQLAAGVAHEINNPIGFVTSNLCTLDKYVAKTVDFINAQAERVASHTPPEIVKELTEKRKALKLDYILDDMKNLIRESLEGTGRVQKIVQDLKSFSRVDAADHSFADINACLESTINIVWNEIKYKATLQRDFGDLPQVKCYPQQLNQVFMNLLINAAHAIDKDGNIIVRSRYEDGLIQVAISDTGCGIPENIRTRIFEPFFTTKDVGKGTGLGLSISYDIVKKHGGEIRVASEVDRGTTFTVLVPVAAG